jgi:hypothetical protein
MVARWHKSRAGPGRPPRAEHDGAIAAPPTAVTESIHRAIDHAVRRIVLAVRNDALHLGSPGQREPRVVRDPNEINPFPVHRATA